MPAFLPPEKNRGEKKSLVHLEQVYTCVAAMGFGDRWGEVSARSHLLVFFVSPLTSEGHKRHQLKNIEKWNHH